MDPNYIPADDPGKLRWILHFDQWFRANGADFGFSPAQLADMAARAAAFRDTMTAHQSAQAAARAATQTKNQARAAAIALGRTFAQEIQNKSKTTDADRAAAGLTVPDTTPTRTAPDTILTIPAPLLLLDFSVRRQVTVHWGPNPANEHENGRPAGTLGCQIQAARGGVPTDETGWVILDTDTQSPLIHTVEEDMPTTFAYRARYLGKTLKYGPFSEHAACTVSV